MPRYCPLFGMTKCPESSDCAIWTDFGCCLIDKPGIPAEYTDPPAEGVDIYILQIVTTDADPQTEILIIYALESDGTIHLESDISKFTVHKLH